MLLCFEMVQTNRPNRQPNNFTWKRGSQGGLKGHGCYCCQVGEKNRVEKMFQMPKKNEFPQACLFTELEPHLCWSLILGPGQCIGLGFNRAVPKNVEISIFDQKNCAQFLQIVFPLNKPSNVGCYVCFLLPIFHPKLSQHGHSRMHRHGMPPGKAAQKNPDGAQRKHAGWTIQASWDP